MHYLQTILKIFLLILIPILIVQTSFAQQQTIQSFIPKNFKLLDSASGDFNQDGNKDVVLILDSNQTGDTRPLLILLGNSNKQFTLFARNDSVVLCKFCGGVCCDPYSHVVIKKEYFSIEQYGGDNNERWTRVITFKFDKIANQFVLHKDATVYEDIFDNPPKKNQYQDNNKIDFDTLAFSKYSNAR
jgi:hypothetical protein